MNTRLKHMEPVLAKGRMAGGSFSVADILMADVLRLIDRFDGLADYPACRACVARATARPDFKKAYANLGGHGIWPVAYRHQQGSAIVLGTHDHVFRRTAEACIPG